MILPEDLELVEPDDAELLDNLDWYQKTLKVRNDRGTVVPFQLLPAQVRLERIKVSLRRKNLPVYVANLKSRRVGASTWTAAAFYKDAHDFPGRQTIMIAHDDKSTKNMLAMVRFFFRSHHGKDVRAARDASDKLVLPGLESEFSIYTAGSRERAARSFAAQSLLLSEIDYYEVEDVYTAAMQVLPDAYPAFVVVESTSRGPGGQMEQMWRRVEEETTDFVGNFTGWFDRPENVRKPTWTDLYRYAPTVWRENNRPRVKAIMEVIEDVLGSRKNERDFDGSGSETGEGPGKTDAPRSGEQTGETGGAQAATPDDPATPDEVGGAGDFPGRRVPRGVQRSRPEWNGPYGIRGLPDGASTGRIRSTVEARRKRRQRKSSRKRRSGSVGLRRTTRDYQRLIADPETFLMENFKDSMTDYEIDITIENHLEEKQLNWLRWCQFDKCGDSEMRRKREHPSRPEEAFEFSDEAILNPHVISEWIRDARKNPGQKLRFKFTEHKDGRVSVKPVLDAAGKTTMWEEPQEGVEYVMGVDPASGTERGDNQVACVLRKDTGNQVAELRCRMEPHLAINEVEGLGIWYNCAYTAPEANSIGLEWARRLSDRGTLPIYQRQDPSRYEPGKLTPRLGWLTTSTSRNQIFTTMRQVVTESRCRLWSLDTLRECTTLWEGKEGDNRGKIEARPNCKDDGVMAWGIALRMLPQLEDEGEDRIVEDEGGPSEAARALLAQFAAKSRNGRLPPLNYQRKHVVARSPTREGLT